jgi:hypothetical protein
MCASNLGRFLGAANFLPVIGAVDTSEDVENNQLISAHLRAWSVVTINFVTVHFRHVSNIGRTIRTGRFAAMHHYACWQQTAREKRASPCPDVSLKPGFYPPAR